ncbi:MAG: hypothetical protein K1Y36_12045 [Blastocatellia bacterium]|nr:hypothetical protein [Blastocatellia bacterium]
MRTLQTSNFLRWVLAADATTSVVTGLLMVLDTELLERLFGLSPLLLRGAGLACLGFAAFLFYLITRKEMAAPLVWAVIVLNVLWVGDSFLLLVSGWVAPTTLGTAFVITQALGVALLAELEYVGLKKSPARPQFEF